MSSGLYALLGVVVASIVPASVELIRASLHRSTTKTDARDVFQRETLLECQEWMYEFGRLTTRVHLADAELGLQGKPFGRSLLPEGLAEGFRTSTVRGNILAVRIDDERARILVSALIAKASDISTAKSYEQSYACYAEFIELGSQANHRLGELLRQTF